MRILALAAVAACMTMLALPAEARRHDGATGLVTAFCGDRVCGAVDTRWQNGQKAWHRRPKRVKPLARPGAAMSKKSPSKVADKIDMIPLPRSRPLHPMAWLAVEPDPAMFVVLSIAQFSLEVRHQLVDVASAALGKGPRALGTRPDLWCADFINKTLAKVGLRGTGSDLAASFARWGRPAVPAPGVVAVKPRRGGNHVVIIKEVRGDQITAISGNSGRAVRLMRYKVGQFYAFRSPDVTPRL